MFKGGKKFLKDKKIRGAVNLLKTVAHFALNTWSYNGNCVFDSSYLKHIFQCTHLDNAVLDNALVVQNDQPNNDTEVEAANYLEKSASKTDLTIIGNARLIRKENSKVCVWYVFCQPISL